MAKKVPVVSKDKKKIVSHKNLTMNILVFDDGSVEKKMDVKNMSLAELLGQLEVARLDIIDQIRKSDTE